MTKRMVGFMMVAAAALVVAGCDDETTTAPLVETFTALLTGFNETPAAINTAATGTGKVVFNSTGFTWELNVKDISNITAAHIHTAVTGGVVLNVNPTTTGNTTAFTGLLSAGTATSASTLSAGFTLDSLKSLIRRGNAYFNVHNTANPGGHIRGQLVPAQ